MLKRFGLVMAAASLSLATASVHAQLISKEKLKCEDTTNKTLGKFAGSKAKCITKCIGTQRKAVSPSYAGCFSPYADPTEMACISGSLKGAEAKAGAGIAKSCAAAASCPNCYTPSTKCTDASGANPFVQSTESNLDTFAPLIYCVENGGNTPSTADGKCEDGLTKALVKFVQSKGKCYQKCNDNMNKGKALPGSCTPPATDPATVTCISDPLKGAEAKSNAAIAKACPTFPACSPIMTPAGWTSLAESAVDSTTGTVYCGSPSGAFLN